MLVRDLLHPVMGLSPAIIANAGVVNGEKVVNYRYLS